MSEVNQPKTTAPDVGCASGCSSQSFVLYARVEGATKLEVWNKLVSLVADGCAAEKPEMIDTADGRLEIREKRPSCPDCGIRMIQVTITDWATGKEKGKRWRCFACEPLPSDEDSSDD